MSDELRQVNHEALEWQLMASHLAYRLTVLLGSEEVLLGTSKGVRMSARRSMRALADWKAMGGKMPSFMNALDAARDAEEVKS